MVHALHSSIEIIGMNREPRAERQNGKELSEQLLRGGLSKNRQEGVFW